jgi:conjugal transfer pilus assembly protein TraV
MIARSTLFRACLPLLLSLGACTHFGTHISGRFDCRAGTKGCEPVSVADARATRELLKADEQAIDAGRPTVPVVAADSARTGERTLRVVFPAHVDAAGTLHEEAVAWAVVEAPRWAGELRRDAPGPKATTLDPLKRALREAASRPVVTASAAPATDAPPTLESLPHEDSAPSASPFHSVASSVLPSPGGAADAGDGATRGAGPVAEGSDMPTPLHDRTPRFPALAWPSAAAINAAKAKTAAPAKPAPRQKDSK